MQVNDILKLECVDLNHQGMGVCKVEGFPIFVSGILIGEVGKVEILKLDKNFGYGSVKEILKTSQDRVKPICPIFGVCGGCEIMHLQYQAQLKHKVKMAQETFKRIGHLENIKIDQIIGMDDPYYYRNKVQIPYQMKKDKVIFGFYKKRSHEVISFDVCYIQPLLATDIAKFVRNLANEYKISAYNDESKKGVLRHVLIRKNIYDEYMVVLITKEDKIPFVDEVVSKIVKRYPSVKTIIHNINYKDTNVILGQKSKILFGDGVIIDEIDGLKFYISHQSFFQTNHIQTSKLYQLVLDYANPNSNETIVDGYCGVGTISLLLARKCKHVIGIEIVEEAINDAKKNAKLNDISNVSFIVGKTEEEVLKIDDLVIDTIVIDPPRKGCDKVLLEAIKNKKIKKIVYVSCDVATLARDLQILSTDYNILSVSLVDMFPHISEIESIVLLHRK